MKSLWQPFKSNSVKIPQMIYDVSVQKQTAKDCGVAWILHHSRAPWHRLWVLFFLTESHWSFWRFLQGQTDSKLPGPRELLISLIETAHHHQCVFVSVQNGASQTEGPPVHYGLCEPADVHMLHLKPRPLPFQLPPTASCTQCIRYIRCVASDSMNPVRIFSICTQPAAKEECVGV